MDPQVVAAVIAGALTVIGTLAAQYFGRRGASKDAEKAQAEQREQLAKTFAEQRAQIDKTLKAQSEQLDKTLAEQRTRTLNERFATASEQLGSDKPAVRLAGVYAMAGLADDWEEHRQTCIDVLCAYLRMPYEPDPGQEAPETQRLAFNAIREIRHTVIRVITAHLKNGAAVSWQNFNFDFTGVVFDGGDFTHAHFSGGEVKFCGAQFSGGTVRFDGADFSGGIVLFGFAQFANGAVYFNHAQFSGSTVQFDGASFSGGTVGFDAAQFSGGVVRFDGARFSGGIVDFGSTFDGDDLSSAEFSGGTVSFHDAKFSGGTVHFHDAKFSGGKVDFGGAADWSAPPTFRWTDTPPSGVELP